jgi:hypothetical protein
MSVGQCSDLYNIFASKKVKNIANVDSNSSAQKIHNLGFKENRQFFRRKLVKIVIMSLDF